MATKRLSPTASLLKNSRLFSLPPPLPRPSHDFTATSNFGSDTATLPYPTHAAIETPQSSLARGDWGLKRPLPQKSAANTSTPTIRIDEIDSIDHITDFESAADHALTLQKWQEIGLPLSMPVKSSGPHSTIEYLNTRITAPTSVFEPAFDNTERKNEDSNTRRWKFIGPWLAGKTEGDFDRYRECSVKPRQLEFKHFVRNKLKRQRRIEEQRIAQETGEHSLGATEILEKDVDLYFKELRRDEARLHMLIEEFLDLPVAQDPARSDGTSVVMMDSDRGPPKTHLSAGLSYLRTASHMTNHPVLGPMKEDPPIQARVLRPQTTNQVISHNSALLGVGGVAADDWTKRTTWKSTNEKSGIKSFDPDIEGGAKIWVRPDRASIDTRGRIKMHVLRVDSQDEVIYEGNVVQPPTRRSSAPIDTDFKSMPKLDSFRFSDASKDYSYGLSSDGTNQQTQRAAPLKVSRDTTNSRQSLLDLLGSGRDGQ
ncbi:MAG: hypothetical protein Q9222_005965 [Ikaeria aurantiellina]